MECFRIDESGYTGFDLLNPDQLFQGASAIAISDEDAARLIKEHFPRLQASELKYRSLSRRPGNHQRLLSLQRDLLTNYKSATYVCDKRYLLVLMFVDYAVEPFYYERGIDFYENGQNYAMASLLTMAGPALLGQAALDNMLAAFQRAVKDKTPEALKALVAAARAARWREFPEALGPLAQYAAPECLSAIATPGVNTDAALVVLQSLISRMEVMADGAYRVEHDQSKNLLSYHDLLQRFIDHDQEIEFHQTEIASIALRRKPIYPSDPIRRLRGATAFQTRHPGCRRDRLFFCKLLWSSQRLKRRSVGVQRHPERGKASPASEPFCNRERLARVEHREAWGNAQPRLTHDVD